MLGLIPSTTISLDWKQFIVNTVTITLGIVGFRFLSGTYRTVQRYAVARDYVKLIMSDFLAWAVFVAINRAFFSEATQVSFIRSICLVVISTTISVYARLTYQVLQGYLSGSELEASEDAINVAIVGAGEIGSVLVNEMRVDEEKRYNPYCFFDSDPEIIGKYIKGLMVYSGIGDEPIDTIASLPIKEIIIALPNISAEEKFKLFEKYSRTSLKVRAYDFPMSESGKHFVASAKRIVRDIKIDDLLFRNTIDFADSREELKRYYCGKTILVTGGGSIGGQLCTILSDMNPKQLIILDIYENGAYDIQQAIRRKHPEINMEVVIASVRDAKRMDEVMGKYRPQVVFHAAAHKHVPLMENNPAETIKNNVLGTLNTVNAAEKWGVEKFLLISTDKAVNPTNIMGASKRMCEMILRSRGDSKTEFVAVRFGNVLGSNGSVVHLFRKKIAAGGPITITDRRIIRYFMTISKAVHLVLETAVLAHKSEIFVLDMRKPVKILRLAEQMITLNGLVPNVDIQIVETGLRKGEKLYEELLIKKDNLTKTSNNLIFIEQDDLLTREELDEKIRILTDAMDGDYAAIFAAYKKVVPTLRTPEEVNSELPEREDLLEIEQENEPSTVSTDFAEAENAESIDKRALKHHRSARKPRHGDKTKMRTSIAQTLK